MHFTVSQIAQVANSRPEIKDDHWGDVISEISLLPHIPEEAFDGIEAFSHLEIIYIFNRVDESQLRYTGYPRGNKHYPLTGIFAQRKKDRPNRIGLCTVELISRKGRSIRVKRLDAIDGTPVIDIKPVLREFQPAGTIRQPEWASEIMKAYWEGGNGAQC